MHRFRLFVFPLAGEHIAKVTDTGECVRMLTSKYLLTHSLLTPIDASLPPLRISLA